jgi:hypothetical protein
MPDINLVSPKWAENVQDAANGFLPAGDNSSIDSFLVAWRDFKSLLNKSVTAGSVFSNPIVSTYSLVYSAGNFAGGIIAPNGDIHFIPRGSANRGQKINITTGVVSTYSLIYSTLSAYYGGVLAPNGDIHFVPGQAAVGQKIDINGTVSTYSLVYTTSTGGYRGGVLAPNGDIHFVIGQNAAVGQKISAGVVSTYSLVYTTSSGAYAGGILAPNGDIHFIPTNATVGQVIRNNSGITFPKGVLFHPYLNKF